MSVSHEMSPCVTMTFLHSFSYTSGKLKVKRAMQELTPCPTKCITRHFSIILYFRELTEKLRVLFNYFHFLSVRNETLCDMSWLNELAERSCVFYSI